MVEMMGEVPLYLETKLTLLKMNPALKTDVYFMKFVVQGLLNFTDMETNAAEGTYCHIQQKILKIDSA